MEPWQIAVGIQCILAGAAWGDLRRQVAANRQVGDDRHAENRDRLARIEAKVDNNSAAVREHDALLKAKRRR